MTEPDSTPPTLVVTGGPQDGATVACEGSNEKILGSDAGADLQLTGGNVAPSHAVLKWTGEHLLLTDAGSPTGTYVNGERISEPYPLGEGDRVYLGPPGSVNSVSLLVCPAVEDKGDSFLFTPEAESDDSGPLVLEEPSSVAPAFDFLAPSPTPARPDPPAPPVEPEAEPEPIKLKPMSPLPTAVARKPQKPEYSSDMPSIGGDRVREPVRLPPAAAPRGKGARKSGGGLPLPTILGGVALLVVLGGGAAFMFLKSAPPVLDSVSPDKSEPGGTVALTGTQFAPDAAGNTVLFGGKPGQVLAASETKISAKIPADAAIGELEVSVKTRGGRSSPVSLRVARTPQVTSIEPAVALPGAEIVVSGARLDGASPTVTVGGREAELISSDASSLRVRIPPDLPAIEGRSVPVSVSVGGESSKPLTLMVGRLPFISEVSPSSAAAGARITVRGLGFAPNPGDNVVRFGDKVAVMLQGKPGELVVVSPGSERSGAQVNLDVRIEAGGSTSSPRPFILTRSSSGTFVPRFYPESVADHPGHDHVLVMTDLAPLMVLTGPADAPSTGQRALTVTDALNALVEAAFNGKLGAVEAREKPTPCVAVVGAPGCLATVTPRDVAAYEEKWTGDKPARANAALLATHWAAVLEDHLTLFLRKERPYRVLETSPRGKVLLEIYGEAVRKVGAGNGVPTLLVSPVPMKWAAPLRDMALSVPAGGQARGAAAIEGLWVGTANDGAASREIRVRFQLDGSGKPEGSLTTKRGKLSMDVPLTEVSYDKGTVRFVALLTGQPTAFTGTLRQGALSGTLQIPGKPDGRFSLSYVE